MANILKSVLFITVSLLFGCAGMSRSVSDSWRRPGAELPRITAIVLVKSPDDLNAVLEQRWPLDLIENWVADVQPTPHGQQGLSLAPADIVWKHEMHTQKSHSLTRINWTAKIWKGELWYAIYAERDGKVWVLEHGDPGDLLDDSLIPRDQ